MDLNPHGAELDKERAHDQASSLVTGLDDSDRTLGASPEAEQEEEPVEPAGDANEEQRFDCSEPV